MSVSIERLGAWLDEERYEEAASASPNGEDEASPKYWAYKGYANWKLSRHLQAIRDFAKAIEIQPRAANTLFLRGRCYEESDRFAEAVGDYEAVLRLNPRTADAHAHLGFCLECLGKIGQARQSYVVALQIDPEETLALAGLKSLAPIVQNS